MGTRADDLTLIDDKDMVAVHDSGNTLCNEDRRLGIAAVLTQGTAEIGVGLVVQCRGGPFVRLQEGAKTFHGKGLPTAERNTGLPDWVAAFKF